MKHTIEHREFSEYHGRFEVKSVGRERLGYLNWTIDESGTLHIDDVFIFEQQRQRGIGSELIRSLIRLAESKGVGEIYGLADKDDPLLHRFYKKHGFFFENEPNHWDQLPFRLYIIGSKDD